METKIYLCLIWGHVYQKKISNDENRVEGVYEPGWGVFVVVVV